MERQYDAARPAYHSLYRTQAWRRLAAEVTRDATRCTWCLKPTRRLVADHVETLESRPDLAMERSNLVAACIACNTKRGKNARLPDLAKTSALGTTPSRPVSTVGERMAHILGVER